MRKPAGNGWFFLFVHNLITFREFFKKEVYNSSKPWYNTLVNLKKGVK